MYGGSRRKPGRRLRPGFATSSTTRRSAFRPIPATEPSSLTTELFLAMEKVFRKANPPALVVPYMSRGATDGSFLRQKGIAVYGVPIFVREGGESRAHGNDER